MQLYVWTRIIWSLIRPQTYLLMFTYLLLGVFYGLWTTGLPFSIFFSENFGQLVAVLVAIALWYSAGTALNDYTDYEIDMVNLPNDAQRPFVQGKLTKQDLLRYTICASALTLLIAIYAGGIVMAILFGALLLLNVIYSVPPVQLSHRGAWAPLLLPLGYVVLPLTTGLLMTSAHYHLSSYLLTAALYIHFISRIILKDYRDVVGDAQFGKKTLVLQFGGKRIAQTASILFAISSMLFVFLLLHVSVVAVPFILFFSGAAIVTLQRLSEESIWAYQRPFITIFGRMCSAIVTVTIIGYASWMLHWHTYQVVILLTTVSFILFQSTFAILQLQHPSAAKKLTR